MNDNRDRGDDRISRPPAGAVPVKTIGSWSILFSEAEQSIYIVSIDYHPEPFRISLSDLKELRASLLPKRTTQAAPAGAPEQKPAKKKMRRHQKRQRGR
jgi:hypothetical protein